MSPISLPSGLRLPRPDAPAAATFLASRMLPIGAAVVVVAVLALLAWGISRPRDTVGLAPVHARDVPDLSLQMMDGSVLRFSDLRGRPALVNFWASWCVPCEAEAPVLEAAARQYGSRVAFVGVNVQDTEADARRFLERFRVSYPNARDQSGQVAVAFGMTGVPETYVLDGDGRIVGKWNGALTAQSIDRLLRDVLPGGS